MKTLLAGPVTLLLLAVLFSTTRLSPFAAPDMASAATDHPLVGSWSGRNLLLTFAADGTATGTDKDGFTYHGAWKPAASSTATFILQTLFPEGGGQGLMGPLMVDEASDELIVSGDRLMRLVPPDAADYDFPTPAAP